MKTHSNPVKPSQTRFKTSQTQYNPVKPSQTNQNPFKPWSLGPNSAAVEHRGRYANERLDNCPFTPTGSGSAGDPSTSALIPLCVVPSLTIDRFAIVAECAARGRSPVSGADRRTRRRPQTVNRQLWTGARSESHHQAETPQAALLQGNAVDGFRCDTSDRFTNDAVDSVLAAEIGARREAVGGRPALAIARRRRRRRCPAVALAWRRRRRHRRRRRSRRRPLDGQQQQEPRRCLGCRRRFSRSVRLQQFPVQVRVSLFRLCTRYLDWIFSFFSVFSEMVDCLRYFRVRLPMKETRNWSPFRFDIFAGFCFRRNADRVRADRRRGPSPSVTCAAAFTRYRHRSRWIVKKNHPTRWPEAIVGRWKRVAIFEINKTLGRFEMKVKYGTVESGYIIHSRTGPKWLI